MDSIVNKSNGLIGVFFLSTVLLVAASTPSNDPRVQSIARRYNNIEGQLDRSVHYSRLTENKSGFRELLQAWFSEAGDLLKVSEEEGDGQGKRKLSEVFFEENPVFVLLRTEKRLPNGGTHVDESREYFGRVQEPTFESDCARIRKLTKSADFEPGDSLDTRKIQNKLEPTIADAASPGGFEYRTKAEDIVSILLDGKPDKVPPGFPPGDSTKYRLMRQTTSPDGRFALGWAPGKESFEWATYAEESSERPGFPEYGALNAEASEERCRNYIVDLEAHTILGTTGATFEGTRPRYNHRGCSVTWSQSSNIFIQCTEWKWYTDACRVGLIENGRLAGCIDLLENAKANAYGFLKQRNDSSYRKHGEDFSILVSGVDAIDNGMVRLNVLGQIPKSDDEDSSFEVEEIFKLKSSKNGVEATLMKTAYAH